MAVQCDVRRHQTHRGLVEQGGELVEGIKVESFTRCAEKRSMIINTEQGRVGVCPKHLIEYSEFLSDKKKAGKEGKSPQPWTRLRRGVIVMGPEIPITTGG